MGHRAVAITEDIPLPLPQWFIDKWHEDVHIGEVRGNGDPEKNGKPSLPIAYKYGRKYHEEFFEDLQKVIAEQDKLMDMGVQIVMMHEDGKLNRITIYADHITTESPRGWQSEAELWQY